MTKIDSASLLTVRHLECAAIHDILLISEAIEFDTNRLRKSNSKRIVWMSTRLLQRTETVVSSANVLLTDARTTLPLRRTSSSAQRGRKRTMRHRRAIVTHYGGPDALEEIEEELSLIHI